MLPPEGTLLSLQKDTSTAWRESICPEGDLSFHLPENHIKKIDGGAKMESQEVDQESLYLEFCRIFGSMIRNGSN